MESKIKEMSANVGTSAEINGVWYKFQFGIVIEFNENDNSEEVKEAIWNTCEEEVTKKMQEVAGGFSPNSGNMV